eukprot:1182448-Prorocentrum_minimum.AAC.9
MTRTSERDDPYKLLECDFMHLDDVLGLHPVLDEKGVPHDVEGDVVLHAEAVSAVDGHRAVV